TPTPMLTLVPYTTLFRSLRLGQLAPGQLVGLIHEASVADAQWAVPVVGHAVVAKAIDVVDLDPVVIDREEEVARKLAIEIGALAEAAEVVLGERSHERVLAIP